MGNAVVKLLTQEGCRTHVLDVKTTADGLFQTCDVRDYNQVRKCIQNVVDKEGRIDVLFIAAGVHLFANIEDTTRPSPAQIRTEVWMALVHGAAPALRDPRLSRAGNWLAKHLTGALEALVRVENWLRTPNERELRTQDREILQPLLGRVGDQAGVVAELVLGPDRERMP